MWRMAHIAYMFATFAPNGAFSNGKSGASALWYRPDLPSFASARGRPAKVMSAMSVAGGDRLRGMIDMDQIGRAAGFGAVHMPYVLQAKILDH